MRRFATAVIAAALASAVVAPSALAIGGGGQSGDAPGQARALENCISTINRQDAKGGGPGDGNSGSKPAAAAEPFAPSVTNCDHFWQSVPNK